jgi:hypothetical protein
VAAICGHIQIVMLSFHISIHARAPEVACGNEVELDHGVVHTLAVPQAALATAFQISFEDAGAALAKLDRMFFEPDGSFVWASPSGQTAWQVDGNLFDRNGRLLFVDLKGSCPSEQFDRLLSALGWPIAPLMFQLVREAVFLDEAEFRRYAAG